MKIKLFTHSDNDGLGCVVVLKTICKAISSTIEVDYSICEPSANAPNFIDKEIKTFLNNGADEINKYDYIFITDLSPSCDAESINTLIEINRIRETVYDDKRPIIILDHHKTSPFFENNDMFKRTKCKGIVEAVDETGVKTCGTTLLYEYLANNFITLFGLRLPIELYDKIRLITSNTRIDKLNEIDTIKYSLLISCIIRTLKFIRRYAEVVRLYDTWDWKSLQDNVTHPNNLSMVKIVLKINNLANEMDTEQFIEEMVLNLLHRGSMMSTELDEMEMIGPLIPSQFHIIADFLTDASNRYVSKRIERAYINNNIAYVTADKHASEIGNGVCLANPDVDFCVIVCGNIISLRTTKDDIDVSEIAKRHGGGGHQKAAGFSISKEASLETYINLFSSKE